jgi:hypothetical protein
MLAACSSKTGTQGRDAANLPAPDATMANDRSGSGEAAGNPDGIDHPRDTGSASIADVPADGLMPAQPDAAPDSSEAKPEAAGVDAGNSDGLTDLARAATDVIGPEDAGARDGASGVDAAGARDGSVDVDAPGVHDAPADGADAAQPNASTDAGDDLAPDAPTTLPNAYFASPAGNDSTGDGSATRPWKTILFALGHIDYSRGLPTLNLGAGTYDEKVLVHDSIVLQGAGSTQVTVQNSAVGDIDYVITADGSNPTVAGPVAVALRGIRVNGLAAKNRGIQATKAVLALYDVNVFQPSAYGISIGSNISGFSIDHTTVGFEGLLYSDVGIDVASGSSGAISSFVGGDHIDHIINIGLGCTVTIKDSHLTGSTIFYADGIRIQGASNVTIQNTTIVRPAGSEPVSTGALHNPPYAGIEIAASSNGNALVRVDGVTVSGFDVGVGVNLWYNGALVENSTISGNLAADVQTMWTGSLPLQYPTVDLGGGALGSAGNNNFGTGPEYAVELRGPYDVTAQGNTWGATGASIEARIHDQLDDAKLGRVHY